MACLSSGTGGSQSPPGSGAEANKAVLPEMEVGAERKPREAEAVAARRRRVKAGLPPHSLLPLPGYCSGGRALEENLVYPKQQQPHKYGPTGPSEQSPPNGRGQMPPELATPAKLSGPGSDGGPDEGQEMDRSPGPTLTAKHSPPSSSPFLDCWSRAVAQMDSGVEVLGPTPSPGATPPPAPRLWALQVAGT